MADKNLPYREYQKQLEQEINDYHNKMPPGPPREGDEYKPKRPKRDK